jgi:serine/threonine protein phosphatase 1
MERPLADVGPITPPVPSGTGGRRLVVPDIHGCRRTFEALLDRVQLDRSDQLFLLGDYINKGPDSSGVLEHVFALLAQGYAVFTLRGNHEQEMMNHARQGPRALRAYAQEQHSEDLLDAEGRIVERYHAFMRQLPFYFVLDDCFLVHAGFDFEAERPFADLKAMLEIRNFPVDPAAIDNKKIIHGHNPLPLPYILQQLETGQTVIPLDNGCVYFGERAAQGNLLCLELDTFALIAQPNVE